MTTPGMDPSTICAARGCEHPRKSHALWGECTEKRAFYNERLFGFDQPLVYKLCGCTWVDPAAYPARAVADNPQA